MSRSRLSIFAVDLTALAAFESDLKLALTRDDRDGLIRLLSLEDELAGRVRGAAAAVDLFLASETHPPVAPLFAALRNAAKDRALTLAWTSESLALEGRLRGYEDLRENGPLASLADRLLGGQGVPWFLRREGDTCGCLSSTEAEQLAEGLEQLDDPPAELLAFGQALAQLQQAAALCHDTLL
jgi:hypothetical protein